MLVVDDHALFRDGLIALIGRWSEFEVVGSACNGAQAVDRVRQLQPDLVLMDVRMQGMSGVEATRQITAVAGAPRIAMLTVSELGEDVFEALRSGAHGYLSKNDSAESLRGIMLGEAVMSSSMAGRVLAEFARPGTPSLAGTGRQRLSRRERDVLECLVEGLSNDEMAKALHLSEATVKKHLGSIMAKLHLRNRVQVAVFGVRRGLVG